MPLRKYVFQISKLSAAAGGGRRKKTAKITELFFST
jgi:hypothetical protein